MAPVVITGITAAALYLLASLFVYWALQNTRQPERLYFRGIGILAVAFHSMTLWQLMLTSDGLRLGLFPAASLVTGTGAALVVIASIYRRIEWVSALVFPLSALTIPPALWLETGYIPHTLSYGVGTHVLLSILAFAILAIAAAQSVLILIQHRQLKHGHIRGIMRRFPPLQIMEKMLFEMLWAGILVLTLSIITGFVYLDDMFAQRVAHKTILTMAGWCAIAVLLGGRHILGWRALTAVWLTFIAFGMLMLGFFGTKIALEIILQP